MLLAGHQELCFNKKIRNEYLIELKSISKNLSEFNTPDSFNNKIYPKILGYDGKFIAYNDFTDETMRAHLDFPLSLI